MLLVLLACAGPDDRGHDGPPDRTPPVPTTSPPLAFDGPAPTNVLMISIDTTRRDHIDRYADDGIVRTPFLAGLLAEGVALDDHVQCSNWTFGSTSCTLEGRVNEDTGWVAKLPEANRTGVPAGRLTLAARLEDLGYHSILVSSNDWLSDSWNNAQGYSVFQREVTAHTATLLNSGLDLLKTTRPPGVPWLLHVHLVQAHPPYTPPDPYDDEAEALPPVPWDLDTQQGQYSTASLWPSMTGEEQALLLQHLEARYTGELRMQDDHLAAWWEQIDAEGWLDDTLVVFWTDHGEQFFEHTQQAHAYGLAAEENDGVLGFWASNLRPGGWVGPTHAIDLLPTVLDVLGVPDAELPGYVLGTAPPERPRYAGTVAREGPIVSVLKDGWKLEFHFDGRIRVWDRATDRDELDDRYDPDHPRTQELWDLARYRVDLLAPLVPEYAIVWPDGLPH